MNIFSIIYNLNLYIQHINFTHTRVFININNTIEKLLKNATQSSHTQNRNNSKTMYYYLFFFYFNLIKFKLS